MKKRLDILLVEQEGFQSREKAKAVIMSGNVYVNGQKADKPGELYDASLPIEVRGNPLPYVSRGGLKLKKSISAFSLRLSGKTCMDIGASTGGFTDCMLQHGAEKVYAVDVGYGQLAWKLRTDDRVVNLERTNARYLTAEEIPEPIDFASMDVSFISITKILPVIWALLSQDGQMVCLIKPQFEAGREHVGKKGVVRDSAVHKAVIEKVVLAAREVGFSVLGLSFSPIKGPEGNIEYLLHLAKSEAAENHLPAQAVADTVAASHQMLNGA